MKPGLKNSYNSLKEIIISGKNYKYFSLIEAENNGLTGINKLPSYDDIKSKDLTTNFISEEVLIKELDYFYTNSISRASKTMSECHQINKNLKKNGTNN